MHSQTVWKFSFCSVHFEWWFKFLEKVLILLKDIKFIKKPPISKVESFLKSSLWPKSNMQNSPYTKPLTSELLTQLTCFLFLLKFIEMLWSYQKCLKNWVRRRLGWVSIKNLLVQTIPNKIIGTKWSNPVKLDTKRKVWYLFFREFLTATLEV